MNAPPSFEILKHMIQYLSELHQESLLSHLLQQLPSANKLRREVEEKRSEFAEIFKALEHEKAVKEEEERHG